jgi:hypothetical protein
MKTNESKKPAKPASQAANQTTRLMAPVFIEVKEGQDFMNLLYVKDGNGGFKSLAELQSSAEEHTEVPGMITTNVVETSGDGLAPTIRSLSASPFRICCKVIGGTMYCFYCP